MFPVQSVQSIKHHTSFLNSEKTVTLNSCSCENIMTHYYSTSVEAFFPDKPSMSKTN